MSQTAITQAFERWKAQQGATGESILLDEFVFANVPGLDPSLPIDRSEQMPPAEQIVYRQSVSRKGIVNENAVVHSVVLGADVGDFSFNWIGLTNKETGTLAMIVHAPIQQKMKNSDGQQGNVLTRSFLMEYNGAGTETGINTPAETWQIDFTARLGGVDERQRIENKDIYGAAAFFEDGWLVKKSGDHYFATSGVGYVAGLRAELTENQNIIFIPGTAVTVWVDVCWSGLLTSVWEADSELRVAESLIDYIKDGVQHYVFAIATINAAGEITDLRPKGALDAQSSNRDFMRRDNNLSDINNVEEALVNLDFENHVKLMMDVLLPIGATIEWPLSTPPEEKYGIVFIKSNGCSFDKNVFPELAKIYPSGVTPDERGLFRRAWDDGRNIDPDRMIMSEQSASIVAGEVVDRALSFSRMSNIRKYFDTVIGDTSTEQVALSTTAASISTMIRPINSDYIGAVRPINIAKNILIRAS